MYHPWQLTLDDFLAEIEHRYGRKVVSGSLPSGAAFRYVRLEDPEAVVVLPETGNLVLEAEVVASLCDQLGLPKADFGLDPDPKD